MKISVLGAGSLGCAMGGVLTEAGHEVWLINRHAERVEHLRQHGLVMRVGGVDRTVAVKATTRSDEAGTCDLVIVLVKSFHTEAAMASVAPLLGPQTVALSKTCWRALWAASGCWRARPMWAAAPWALAM